MVVRRNDEDITVRRHFLSKALSVSQQLDQPAAALSEDFPEVARYLESVVLSNASPVVDASIQTRPSQHAQNQVTDSLTTTLLDRVHDIMQRADAEGRDLDDELRQAVGETVLEGMATGYDMGTELTHRREDGRDGKSNNENGTKRPRTDGA